MTKIVLAALVVATLGSTTIASGADPIAQTQRDFCVIVEETRAAYETATNEKNQLKKKRLQGEARAQRKTRLNKLLPNRSVTAWHGTVKSMNPGSEMFSVQPYVTVDLGCGAMMRVELTTTKVTSFFEETTEGAAIEVSGQFAPPTAEDPFREWSLTEIGGMDEPEFGFRASEVKVR